MKHEEPMKTGICGAKTRSGAPCQKSPVAGRTRCRNHGGASLSGPAHPSYKDGRTSKVLPARMREDYERAINDENLVSLRSEIAIIDARILDLLGRVDAGESGKRWKDVQAQMKLVNNCEPDERLNELNTLSKMINAAVPDAYVWDELGEWMIRRERLVRSERKRLVEAKLVIRIDQAQLLMSMFVDSAREAVGNDPAVMGKIVDAFIRLTGHNAAIPEHAG